MYPNFTEAEEKAQKEREAKEKSKPRPPRPTTAASAPKKSSSDKEEAGDDMELDEEDLKIIQDTKKKGYCYFKRTLSEKEQSLLDAEQMKLRAVSGGGGKRRRREWVLGPVESIIACFPL